jgi:hypothetical protein
LATPLLLGLLWGLILAGLTTWLMVLRTALEDKTLQAELAGYACYARRVRYRLIPGPWQELKHTLPMVVHPGRARAALDAASALEDQEDVVDAPLRLCFRAGSRGRNEHRHRRRVGCRPPAHGSNRSRGTLRIPSERQRSGCAGLRAGS